MSEVKLSVGGRDYTVTCAPGEEAHVSGLGLLIDSKIKQLGESVTSQETQKLLFSALFLADDLHEAKKTADNGKEALETAKREAAAAVSQLDERNQAIARLQAEIESLQSAQQGHFAEVDDIRSEMKQRREESEECRSELEKTTAHIAELENERAALATQLEDARKAPASGGPSANLSDDPSMAPALERFADLLETCADKLEAGDTSA